jgi:hypothetical protein
VTTKSSDLIEDAQEKIEEAKEQVDRAVRKASFYIELTARVGLAARGIAYFLVGGLAALAAIGAASETVGGGGAILWLVHRPLGWVIVIGLAVGFGAFGLWQIFWAVRDPERQGSDWKGLSVRFGRFCGGVAQLGLVYITIHTAMGVTTTDETGDTRARDWTAYAMSYPLGRWIVMGIGIGFVGYAVAQVWHAWKLDPDEELHPREMSRRAREVVCGIGRFGTAARAIVFFIVGCFLIIAAWYARPGEARGLGGALHALAEHPYGWLLLAIVALGLIAYGVYAMVQAKYTRIRVR